MTEKQSRDIFLKRVKIFQELREHQENTSDEMFEKVGLGVISKTIYDPDMSFFEHYREKDYSGNKNKE